MSIREQLLKSHSRLISASQLLSLAKSQQGRIVLLDASWYLPNNPRNGEAEFLQTRMKLPAPAKYSVVFADIDAIKDKESPYPHMLPSVSVFNKEISSLGLTAADTVIVYDVVGNFSAPRMAWMLEVFNHKATFLLDTFPEYSSVTGPDSVSTTPFKTLADLYAEQSAPSASVFESTTIDESRYTSYEEVEKIVTDKELAKDYIILDARPAGRFHGTDPEPRPGLSSGHVPGSLSVPFSDVIDPKNFNKFKSKEELLKVFGERGVTPDSVRKEGKKIITMCGTGVTACSLERALRIAEIPVDETPVKVYDGSWTEWAQRAPESLIIKE